MADTEESPPHELNASDTDNDGYDSYDEKLNKVETFGGYNEDGVQKDRKLHRSARTILEPTRCANQKVPVLKNGHSSTVGIPRVVTYCTCGFDSVFSIYAVSYVDYPSIEQEINQNAGAETFEELIKLLFVAKENAILNKRNVLLKKLFADSTFTKQITKRLIEINCECAFDFLNRQLNSISKSMFSLCERKVCESCKYTEVDRYARFVPLDLAPLEGRPIDFRFLQGLIKPLQATDQKCKCGTTLIKKREANKIIVFDADEPLPDLTQTRDTPHITLPSCSIDQIAQRIMMDEQFFNLHAVLCYSYERKHFYAKVKRLNGNWELYDDLEHQAKIVRSDQEDKTQALFYLLGISNLHIFDLH